MSLVPSTPLSLRFVLVEARFPPAPECLVADRTAQPCPARTGGARAFPFTSEHGNRFPHPPARAQTPARPRVARWRLPPVPCCSAARTVFRRNSVSSVIRLPFLLKTVYPLICQHHRSAPLVSSASLAPPRATRVRFSHRARWEKKPSFLFFPSLTPRAHRSATVAPTARSQRTRGARARLTASGVGCPLVRKIRGEPLRL